ncbi:hypothetical protein Q0Z83_109910 [Actinoplanes sichuanensis]|nr:hypothetical protein Q0Z83_109910 [Actinoplanes sichuanensis]
MDVELLMIDCGAFTAVTHCGRPKDALAARCPACLAGTATVAPVGRTKEVKRRTGRPKIPRTVRTAGRGSQEWTWARIGGSEWDAAWRRTPRQPAPRPAGKPLAGAAPAC